MSVKITCVYDEGSQPYTSLIGAKGTSMIVEKDGKRVLFNTGLRDRYLHHNMECLNIDPESIDAVVISQSNPCASGALNGLLKYRESSIDVYCPEGLYGDKSFIKRSTSLTESSREKVVFHDIGTWQDVFDGITMTPYIYDDKGYGETFLVVSQGLKAAILSGRCSCGPAKVIGEVEQHADMKIKAFLGPVLLEKKKKPVAAAYAQSLSQIPDLYINHCVGKDGMVNLRVNLGMDNVKDFYVGDTYLL